MWCKVCCLRSKLSSCSRNLVPGFTTLSTEPSCLACHRNPAVLFRLKNNAESSLKNKLFGMWMNSVPVSLSRMFLLGMPEIRKQVQKLVSNFWNESTDINLCDVTQIWIVLELTGRLSCLVIGHGHHGHIMRRNYVLKSSSWVLDYNLLFGLSNDWTWGMFKNPKNILGSVRSFHLMPF